MSGSQTYPSETKSDAFGQMVLLTTWQNGTSGAAVTTWAYDPPSGLLTSKQYADGNQTTYTYDAAGRLKERKWARGITTSYGYSGAGELTSVSYTGGTPEATFSYDRNGNQLTALGSAGNVTYTVNPTTLLTESETVQVGNSTRTLVRTRDGLLRDTGFALMAGNATEAATAWTYDNAGRASTINATSTGAAPQTFTYQWVAGRPQLIDRVVGPAVTVQNTYEPLRDVLTSKENMKTAGGTLVSGYTYAVNSLGQRTSVQHAGSACAAPAFNVYGYDTLGQVTSAKRFTGGTPAAPTDPVAGQQFGFAYDTIGNRKTATDGNATTAYTPNALNQYTSVNTAAPTYDLDGNLLTDGTHTCEWDGENRLIKVTSGATEISNTYDALSRRVRRTVTNGATVTSDTGYVYDGWNVIAEYNLASSTPVLTAVNTWGLDLSNSRQGAGGVGGLLARTTGGTTQSYTFDGNGNVSELVTSWGSVTGHYEYGPFGQTTVQEDSDATGAVASNPYRFSTKPLDVGSGLYYYGYRYFNPIDGRWVSRDPIGEEGGINRYVIIDNNLINSFDINGLFDSAYAAAHAAGVTAILDEYKKSLASGKPKGKEHVGFEPTYYPIEHGGRICKGKDGYFTTGDAISGLGWALLNTASKCPDGSCEVGKWHSHPGKYYPIPSPGSFGTDSPFSGTRFGYSDSGDSDAVDNDKTNPNRLPTAMTRSIGNNKFETTFLYPGGVITKTFK